MSENVEQTKTQEDLDALKDKATLLGIEFSDRIGYDTLKKRVDEFQENATDVVEVKRKKLSKKEKWGERINVKIEPRFEEDMNKRQGFVGFNGYTATFQYGETINMPINVVEFLKGRGRTRHYRNDKGEAVSKWQSRYFVEKV